MESTMNIHWIYLKMFTTGNKNRKKRWVLEQKSLDRWHHNEVMPGRWEENSMEKERKSSWSKAYSVICHTWWTQHDGMGKYGCWWNWVVGVYWWCDRRQKLPNEFWTKWSADTPSAQIQPLCLSACCSSMSGWIELFGSNSSWNKLPQGPNMDACYASCPFNTTCQVLFFWFGWWPFSVVRKCSPSSVASGTMHNQDGKLNWRISAIHLFSNIGNVLWIDYNWSEWLKWR